jgi:hypothetical protein
MKKIGILVLVLSQCVLFGLFFWQYRQQTRAATTDTKSRTYIPPTAGYVAGTGIDIVNVTISADPTDIDHNLLKNYTSSRHFEQKAIMNVYSSLSTGLLTVTNGTGLLGSTANNTAKWDNVTAMLRRDGTDLTADWTISNNNIFLTNGSLYAASLGIGTGTTAPVTKLQVVDTATTSPRGIMSAQYSATTDGARIHMRKGRGTFAAVSSVVSGDVLGKLVASGWDGSTYQENGQMSVEVDGAVSVRRVPTRLSFFNSTSVGVFERLRIDSSGNVIQKTNNVWLKGTAAGGTDVNMFRVRASDDQIDAGANLNLDGLQFGVNTTKVTIFGGYSSLLNTSQVLLPSGTGFVRVVCGDGQQIGEAYFQADGTIIAPANWADYATLANYSSFAITNAAGKCCLYDAGSQPAILNNTGAATTVKWFGHY